MTSSTYPDHWSTAARDAVASVVTARPDLDGAEAAMLGEAAELISIADALAAAARDKGLLDKGSTGQTVVAAAVVEARLARTAAGALLAKLIPARPVEGSRGGKGRFVSNMSGTGGRR